jgi:hypothetical protein
MRELVRYRQEHLTGDEKGEGQVFLERLFQAFGHGGVRQAGHSSRPGCGAGWRARSGRRREGTRGGSSTVVGRFSGQTGLGVKRCNGLTAVLG